MTGMSPVPDVSTRALIRGLYSHSRTMPRLTPAAAGLIALNSPILALGQADDAQGARHRTEAHLFDLAHVFAIELECHRAIGGQHDRVQIMNASDSPAARRLGPAGRQLPHGTPCADPGQAAAA